MTGPSSKLLQIQGKWYRERKPKKNKTWGKKNPKTILHPLYSVGGNGNPLFIDGEDQPESMTGINQMIAIMINACKAIGSIILRFTYYKWVVQGINIWVTYGWFWHLFTNITLWLFTVAMETGPFIDGVPIKNGDFPWLR